ncbi:SDR family oxidoreductase [Actinocorallia sp. A-T 12471]|uniref:SDR family oxidoreductase n=1 Tax=Actinocorallia sp. A-T 12471 TaxID=3089813 RepID=UPI0029D31D3B|nr:SDR family oxidoreductase [Actinocorallia sp. A-T 12471]MDX6739930.1 SDR family oxidoreductase [Actinocorallia sp. A-T 12471]
MSALKGKTALVTGGSRGIGRAIVERLARDGATVLFNYAARDDAAEEVVRSVEREGGSARAVKVDLTAADAGERLAAAAADHLDGLDILVNNAAVHTPPALLADTTDEDFRVAVQANLFTAFTLMRHAARHMRDGGRVINISTANTVRPSPGNAPYAATKGALEQLTLVAAQELGARGITVNTVSPGATDTDLLRSVNPEEALSTVASMTPLGRLGTPADIADVVAFLASPDARWLTAQNLRATGGLA